MKTFIQNNQTTTPLNLPAIEKLVNKLAGCLVAADPNSVWDSVTVVLTDDEGITQTNRDFLDKDRPTDVISFRYDPIPGEDPAATGDLIINVECALREGPTHEGVDAELALYIAHGFDHLSGADDDTPARRAAMRETELRWLAALKSDIQNLILS